MKRFLYKLTLVTFLLVVNFATAQVKPVKIKDSIVAKESIKAKDSLNTVLLSNYTLKIEAIEAQRKEDSIKKDQLEKSLNNLKTTDNLKKEKLLAQLKELNEKDSKRIAKKKAQIDSLRSTATAYIVTGFFKEKLFSIYSKLGSFSAKDRANAISERIQKLSDYYSFSKDSLKIIHSETTLDLTYGESIIMSVSENDAIWNATTKEELAQKYKDIIADKVMHYKDETSIITIAKEVGLALLILLILGIILYYISKFFVWLAQKIEEQKGKRFNGIKIKDYTLFDADREVALFLFINKALKWFVNLIVVYFTLPILFGIFPWTKDLANTLFGYILNPLKNIGSSVWSYLPNLFTIIVIYVVFSYVIKGFNFLKTEIAKGNLVLTNFYPEWANPTYQIIKVILYAFMFVLIFPYLPGSNSPIFQGVSVFLGFLLTFGSSGSLSNVIAGIVLTYMRLFKIGDRVKIGDVVGNVIEKSLLVTRVKTIKNEIVSIPNSTVMSSHTTNYSSETANQGLIMHTTITLGYDVPWKLVHKTVLEAADRTDLLLKDPKPFVLQTSLDDFYVSYQINAYTKDANKQAKIYSDLHQNIQDCCNEVGIEILSPHYRATRDGNMSTIPDGYLPKDYKAPSFKVNITKEE